jgi:hypothetical protein
MRSYLGTSNINNIAPWVHGAFTENAMHRYKTIIGPKLHSRDFNNQQQEMMLAASILNRFTQLGMPESYRVA